MKSGAMANAPRESSSHERVAVKWLAALRRDQPNLPSPVAQAMVEAALRGPLGQWLGDLDAALSHLEQQNLSEITGSEARTLLAALRQLSDRATCLEQQIHSLWQA